MERKISVLPICLLSEFQGGGGCWCNHNFCGGGRGENNDKYDSKKTGRRKIWLVLDINQALDDKLP